MTTWISVDDALKIAYGDNPLLDALGPIPDTAALAKKLWHRPLQRVPWQRVRPQDRAAFLPLLEDHFVPTPNVLAIAQSFLALIQQHYVRRNPVCRQSRAQLGDLAKLKGAEINRLPWFNGSARAMAVRGITGTGKSITADRLASLLPQTVTHGPCEAAGWMQMRQLNYLRVQMSGDNSRAGFLNQILAQVDEVLGTTYHEQYGTKTRWTVEKLMVVVGIILSRHYCGALIIEELQERNFSDGASRDVMLLFFLRLLNFGIPILLIGNPAGFRAFDTFSQDMRRLYSSGCYDLWPCDSVHDAGWDDFYLPGLAEFHLTDRPHTWTPQTRALAKRLSGGVPGYMTTLWSACQRQAILTGADAVSPDDFAHAARDPALSPNLPLIQALSSHDIEGLSGCQDVPYLDFAQRWGIDLSPQPPVATGTSGAPQADASTVTPKFVVAERKQKARAARNERKAAEPKQVFKDGDLRAEATRNALLDGLANLKATTEGAVPSAPSGSA